MAKIKIITIEKRIKPKKVGKAAKSKTSNNKKSKNYVKKYRGQGR